MLRKKSLVVLAALGFSLNTTIVFAKVAPINPNTLVSIPVFKPGFGFNFAVAALKAGATNLNYVIYNNELPAQSPTWTENEIKPGFRAGFTLGAYYDFMVGQDIALNWTHLSSSSSASTITPNADFFVGPDYEIGPDAIPNRNATGNVQFNYDVINLDAGQHVNFGRHVDLRFFAGLSNTYLREQVTANYWGSIVGGAFSGPFNTEQEVTANFYGLGPRLGIEGTYGLDNGFSFLGEIAGSLLIGKSTAKTQFTSSSQELIALFNQAVNHQFIKDQDVIQVIPGFDAKLGVSYQYLFKQGSLLTVTAGYQAAVYVNAINQYLPGSLVGDSDLTALDTGGIFVATMSHTLSNYSVQGPYIEANLRI